MSRSFECKQLIYPPDQDCRSSIRQLFQQTFADSENQEEGERIGTLASDLIEQTTWKDLFVFIATEKGDDESTETTTARVIGCTIYTRLCFPNQPETTAFLVAPVAVHTNHQKKGVGQSLLRFGLDTLRRTATTASVDLLVVTYGDPKFYSRVGFQQVSTQVIPSPMPLSIPEGWQAQSLTNDEIKTIPSPSICVSAFLNKPELW
jgi:predicted N-acetyltransferase YhbS